MRSLVKRFQESSERGVSAIFIALSMIMIMGFVALGIDISLHTHERQELWDTLDAASLAGAQFLPDGSAAYQAALDYAVANWPGLSPDIDFWCVVGVNGSGNPEASHIPAMCDPGPGPYTAANYPGLDCNGKMCLIPCNPLSPELDTCNTMRVRAEADVDYAFAPVLGINQGSTGVLASASCKGPCGAEISVPGDIALVLDRTGSMNPPDVSALKSASLAFLEGLSPSSHQVALGTIGRTRVNAPSSCPTEPSTSQGSGPWVPIPLSDDYDLTDNDPPGLNPSSPLVVGINCLSTSSTQTNLGDSIQAAGDYLVDNGRPDVPDGVVFMTDGAANQPTSSGSPCDWAESRAQQVKSAGVIVVTIAYRLEGVDCEGKLATAVLANMASDPESGVPTLDDGGDGPGGVPDGCASPQSVAGENSDGDLFFCAPDPSLLSSVFRQASAAILAQFAERTILVRPPV
ncbi:MAG TPA: VWA domain-containing protein [Acidimicrobiia bacterium]|nr:VWA domain-containing protein [Acidimicrobiia bacterium]